MRLSPLHAYRLTIRTHQKFRLKISDLCVIGGESGMGAPSLQPIQTVAEDLASLFPLNVSWIIARQCSMQPVAGKGPPPALPGSHMGDPAKAVCLSPGHAPSLAADRARRPAARSE